MSVIRGTATFPGLPSVESGSYVCNYGPSPGMAYITVNGDLSEVAGIADLTFTDGSNSITLRSARLVDAEVRWNPEAGITATLAFEDRRWLWRYCTTNGHWNMPAVRVFTVPRVPDFDNPQPGPQPVPDAQLYPDGYVPQIQEWTRKNVRELAALLCKDMGEANYDVNQLPDNQYPEVNWDAANPARELQRLAEQHGCRLSYHVGEDMLRIVKLGDGQQLPDLPPGFHGEDVRGIDPPEPPLLITVYGAPILYQIRMTTEPVGEDFDGFVKHIDKLSYRPDRGWQAYGPPWPSLQCLKDKGPMFDILWPNGLPGSYTGYDAYALAHYWVYRAYRIKATLPTSRFFGFTIPPDSDESKDNYRREKIILTQFRAEVQSDEFGQRVVLPGRAFGKALWGGIHKDGTTKIDEQITVPFHVDVHRQLVLFNTWLYYESPLQNVGGGAVGQKLDFGRNLFPTNPVLEVAVMLRDNDNNQVIRYKKSYPMQPGVSPRQDQSGAGRPGELALFKEEVRYSEVYSYTNSNQINTKTTNRPEAERKADYFAAGEASRFQLTLPQTREYNGFIPVYNDGAVQQVSWMFGPGGCSTKASRNTEHEPDIDPYFVRRAREETNLDVMGRVLKAVNDAKAQDIVVPPPGRGGIPPGTAG